MANMADFATAEEAALYVARSPEGQAVAVEQAAAAAPLKSEEARQQAQAEGLTLRVAKGKTGYHCVYSLYTDRAGPAIPVSPSPIRRVCGAAARTCIWAPSPPPRRPHWRRPAAGRAAAAESQGTLPALPSGASLKEEAAVPPMPHGTFVKEESVVPPMPPDACVKAEVVVKEEEGCDSRPKRQRTV